MRLWSEHHSIMPICFLMFSFMLISSTLISFYLHYEIWCISIIDMPQKSQILFFYLFSWQANNIDHLVISTSNYLLQHQLLIYAKLHTSSMVYFFCFFFLLCYYSQMQPFFLSKVCVILFLGMVYILIFDQKSCSYQFQLRCWIWNCQ